MDFRSILNTCRDGIIATDIMASITFVNQPAAIRFGLKTPEVLGLPITTVLPETGELVSRCLASGEPVSGHPLTEKDLSLILDVTPMQDGDRVEGMVCVLRDANHHNHRNNTAKDLMLYKQLNKQFDTIFNSSSDGIWVCDKNGIVIRVNKASERLNEIDATKIIGKDVSFMVNKGFLDRNVTYEVLKQKRQISMMQHVKKTGKHLLVTGTPAFDENGDILLVVVNERDMTELNARTEELKQSQMLTEKIRDELAEMRLREFKGKEIVAESPAMGQVLNAALKLARVDVANILILGESGTGKGLLSAYIHQNSRRHNNPFIQINCAALPESLLEAELFGYEKGAFTGAREQGKAGLIELAKGGTLLLDEIGELPLQVQAKLLKYLDDKEVWRLGGVEPKKIDCTIIAATNRDVAAMTRAKTFRQDLYYRLNTFPIRIPPLRERPEDLMALVRHLLAKYNETYNTQKRISPEGVSVLMAHRFPGNVRELKNLIKNAVVMSDTAQIDTYLGKSVPTDACEPASSDTPQLVQPLGKVLDEAEQRLFRAAMEQYKTTRQLASVLGISQPTVVRKMKKHGLHTI